MLTQYLSKVKDLTSHNLHNEAIRAIAEYVNVKHNRLDGVEKLLKNIDALITLHKMYNCMTPALYEIRKDLKAQIFSFLLDNEIKLFNEAL